MQIFLSVEIRWTLYLHPSELAAKSIAYLFLWLKLMDLRQSEFFSQVIAMMAPKVVSA